MTTNRRSDYYFFPSTGHLQQGNQTHASSNLYYNIISNPASTYKNIIQRGEPLKIKNKKTCTIPRAIYGRRGGAHVLPSTERYHYNDISSLTVACEVCARVRAIMRQAHFNIAIETINSFGFIFYFFIYFYIRLTSAVT